MRLQAVLLDRGKMAEIEGNVTVHVAVDEQHIRDPEVKLAACIVIPTRQVAQGRQPEAFFLVVRSYGRTVVGHRLAFDHLDGLGRTGPGGNRARHTDVVRGIGIGVLGHRHRGS